MVGFGYDVHRLSLGESLILGGIEIKSPFGTVAHSDGDVLVHSIIDAILGAAGLGDIGEHFPDTDPKCKNISSITLLEKILKIIEDNKLRIVNIDATIVLEKPKLSEYKTVIKENLAKTCKLKSSQVNVKATTNEKMGYLGASEGIATLCVCQLERFSA